MNLIIDISPTPVRLLDGIIPYAAISEKKKKVPALNGLFKPGLRFALLPDRFFIPMQLPTVPHEVLIRSTVQYPKFESRSFRSIPFARDYPLALITASLIINNIRSSTDGDYTPTAVQLGVFR